MDENKSLEIENENNLTDTETPSLDFNDVTCKTVYTERLMRSYRKFTEKSSVILTLIMTALFFAADITLFIILFFDYSKESLILFLLFLVVGAINIINLTVIPNIQIKKSPYYEAEINYEFKKEEVLITAKNKIETTTSHLGYSEIKYIKDNAGCFYLHVGTAQAFIVEKENIKNITPKDFETVLRQKISKKGYIEINM